MKLTPERPLESGVRKQPKGLLSQKPRSLEVDPSHEENKSASPLESPKSQIQVRWRATPLNTWEARWGRTPSHCCVVWLTRVWQLPPHGRVDPGLPKVECRHLLHRISVRAPILIALTCAAFDSDPMGCPSGEKLSAAGRSKENIEGAPASGSYTLLSELEGVTNSASRKGSTGVGDVIRDAGGSNALARALSMISNNWAEN